MATTGSSTGSDAAAFAAASSMSILSSKVQRALQIRTDTPAMKAALDALGQLSSTTASGGQPQQAPDFTLDARSVRHAIEYDALQQALLLQTELTSLCTSLKELRQGISQTAQIARQVKQAIHTNVVVASADSASASNDATSLLAGGATVDAALLSEAAASGSMDVASSLLQTQQEERLAASLAEAFAKRNLAQERLTAVHQFLETFDLSQDDARLLDHYNFDDWDATTAAPPQGTAFLAALERVKEIRQALSHTFGGSAASAALTAESASSSSNLGASSALRMMEHLAQKQEQAYERLYHWLQNHLQLYAPSAAAGSSPRKKKQVSFDADPEDEEDDERMDQALQHPFVQAALYTLRHVPAFFRHLLELMASRRRQEETRIFLLALTSGYHGLPPLERLAHDSVHYVGDMLAFSFQSLNTEADVARSLVHYTPESAGDDEEEKEDDEAEEEKEEAAEQDTMAETSGYEDEYAEKPFTASDLLSTSLSGMARPLKSRILQVITSLANRVSEGGTKSDDESDDGGGILNEFEEEASIVRNKLTYLYEICGLLLFYIAAMEKAVVKLERADQERGLLPKLSGSADDEESTRPRTSNALVVNVTACLSEGVRAFEATVRVYSAMLGSLSVSTGDSVAHLAQALLERIAEVRQSSPGFAADVVSAVSNSESQLILSSTWIANQVLDAALPYCTSLNDTVTLQQALVAVQKAGDADADAAARLKEQVHQAELQLIDRLVEGETTKVLQLCGLGSIVSAWEDWKIARGNLGADDEDDELLLVSRPGLSQDQVTAALTEFYASLYAPPLPSLETLVKDVTLRNVARTRIAAQVCEIYQELYHDLLDPQKGGYPSLNLEHSPQQVQTLFSA